MIFQWYVKASIHVSLCLLALVWFTGLVFDTAVPIAYCCALFFGSVAGYNVIKYGLEPRHSPKRLLTGYPLLKLMSIVSLLLAGYFLMLLPREIWVFFFAASLITALYAVPLKPGGANLRSYGVLKVILVALVWTILSVWAPLWGASEVIGWDLGVESFQRMVWVVLLMIPFEIRDMGLDPPAMGSIPQRYGLRKTRMISWGGAVLFALATWMKDDPASGEAACKVIIALLMGLSINYAREKQHVYYSAFWVEGIPLAALGLLLLFQA
jgi:hypothetical protein